MILFKKIADLNLWLSVQRRDQKNIGFVPTMGALHNGHGSLVKQSVNNCDLTVVSIFVNPTQFNDKEDFNKYPSTPEADIALLIDAGCNALFMPGVDEMYPDGVDAVKTYSFGYLETVLEGAQRPGHFKGVGQIVGRLLEIVAPDKLFMGQKDYQQCMVVKLLLEQMKISTELVICPTIREEEGLAMSSRNRRLTEEQHEQSLVIYHCLTLIKDQKNDKSFKEVQPSCLVQLKAAGFDTEYVSLANANTLALLEEYDNGQPMVALIAAKTGKIRLIDNMLL